MLAYLVIREGSKWSDVFRLSAGAKVTIGRASTNTIVLKDERCSRFHAEVFPVDDQWHVRDLDSRNGTRVGQEDIHGERPLNTGDVIRIGDSQIKFVNELHQAFPDATVAGKLAEDAAPEPAVGSAVFADAELSEPTTITHRRQRTKYFQPEENGLPEPSAGQAAARLCRIAFELAKAADPLALAKVALDGLFEGTRVDAGAVFLLNDPTAPPPREPGQVADSLTVVASRTSTQLPYHRVSPFVAVTVLSQGEAVLARNVLGDSMVNSRDSKGEIHASSVLCAPIRRGKRTFGLIHLYTTGQGKPPDPEDLEFTLAVADTVAVALHNLRRRQELAENLNQIRDENQQLRERLGVQSEIIGSSSTMARISREIARAAPTNATVLVRGESGVGKELVARALHFSSPRRRGPFVCLNCAALAESLLESELFGHERGAFTGAQQRKIGKFEASHQGTLMLDEIGEMSPSIQAKFLRVLEGHSFERVGGSEPVKVDVRVIAATNRDLEQDVAEGRFRRDLYFRLHVLEIIVPPLRERPEDVVELAYYFFDRYCRETGRKLSGYTPRALEQLRQYRWPGNVRELKNVVERAVVLAQDEMIDIGDLMLSKLGNAAAVESFRASHEFIPCSLDDLERQHILATLKATRGNKSQAAQMLGIERSTLDRKIRRYNLAEFTPGRAS
ncbi:MAG: sigma 54-interacting transcriptional regulator [Planctomycetes bacterium]|nr:sigma 54-interacting transcriptional regulator [Planctomycetota bacterium]